MIKPGPEELLIKRLRTRIEALEAALRSIANKCPATCDMTLAHEMAQEAEEALAAQEKPAQEKPKEPPPPADEMGTSLKDGWSKDRRRDDEIKFDTRNGSVEG